MKYGSQRMNPQRPVLATQLAAQRQRGEAPVAIFTDLDGTFVVPGNPRATAAAAELFRHTQTKNYPIIAVTGRNTARVLAEIQRGDLPPFNAIIGAVGTEIVLQYTNRYQPDTEFHTQLQAIYDRRQVLSKAIQLLHTGNADYPNAQLQLQQPEVERAFLEASGPAPDPLKISLYFLASLDTDLASIEKLFIQAFPNLKIITSADMYYSAPSPAAPKRYNLDILPASKSDAIRYVMHTYGVKRGIVAGDSGNDIDALLVPGLTAVLVGGHSKGVRTALAGHLPGISAASSNMLHQAVGDKHLFIDTSTTRAGAQSILLVLEHLSTQSSQGL